MKRFLIIILLIGNAPVQWAQDFEVAPVVMRFSADPGTIEVQKVNLRNHANKKQSFELKLADYLIDSLGRKQRFASGSTSRSCADWLTINPAFLEMNPNESAEIEVILSVPESGAGTRWALIYVQTAREQTSFEVDKVLAAGIRVQPRIVIQVTQSPRSNKNYKAAIQNLQEITTGKDTLRVFSVDIKNTGDKIISAKIFLTLANIVTAEEKEYPVQKLTLYPDVGRTITLTLPKDLPKGQYALAAILDYGHGTALEGVQSSIEY